MGRDTSPDTYSIVSTFSFYLTLSLLSIVGSLYLLRKFASPVLDGRYVTFPCTWVLRSFSSLSCRVVSCRVVLRVYSRIRGCLLLAGFWVG